MQDFRNLRVWQRSHALVLAVYEVSKRFSAHELYGLSSQIRRSAVSVPTNIAEGSKRRRRNDYAHFLNMAEASLAEVEYLFILAHDLGYLPTPAMEELIVEKREIASMLSRLSEKVLARERESLTPQETDAASNLQLSTSDNAPKNA